jgi:hypothetical protein
MKFEKKSPTCYVLFYESIGTSIDGRSYERLTAFRCIREGNRWVADWCDAIAGTWLPWEPVFSSETSFPNVRRAQKAIRGAIRRGFPNDKRAQTMHTAERP